MAWSSRRGREVGALALLLLAAANAVADQAPSSDRMSQLATRAAQLDAERAQLAQKSATIRSALGAAERLIAAKQAALARRDDAADRATLERTLAAAREQANALRGLEAQIAQLDVVRQSARRERVALYDQEIDRLQNELDRGGANVSDTVLRRGLARLKDLRRARDQLMPASPASSRHNGSDLAAIVPSPADPPDALAEKADLVATFARDWRDEREESLRQLARARAELDLVRRLIGVMEARRRGRIGSVDPFAADEEAFELEQQETRIVSVIAALERRAKELATWIAQAEQKHLELTRAAAALVRP